MVMAYALHQECVDELLGLAVRSGGGGGGLVRMCFRSNAIQAFLPSPER